VSADLVITERDRARLVKYALHILHNHEDAEDVVQDTLLKCWSRKQYRGDSKAFTYLAHAVYRNAIELIRDRKSMLPFPGKVRFSYRPELERDVDAHQRLILCFNLPGKYRQLVPLVASGMTPQEICERLRLPLNTVKVRVFRMRLALKAKAA